jgi:GNAT superfamily N-acetyltransferase
MSPRPEQIREAGGSKQASISRAASDSVRNANTADVPALTQMLVRAYMDDPVATWICRSSQVRERVLGTIYAARLRETLAHEAVWTNAARSSVAVWAPPGRDIGMRPSVALLRCFLSPSLAARVPVLAVGFNRMRRAHPRAPAHWYLSLLATDPDERGRGLGAAMLQPVLERCDTDGVGIYLESSKQRNLDFYARFGFYTRGELQLPSGPTLWPMWREPHGARA